MRIAIIGRTEILYETAFLLRDQGHEIALIVTAKEAPEYTKTSEDFRTLADSCGIPYIFTPRIDEAIDVIRSLPAIDIGVSLNYSGIIPQSVIELFPLGILNAHGGDLPRYRGNACQAWAILNGESRIGLCIHRMIGDELDSGDIIVKNQLLIQHTTKVTDAWAWMNQRIPDMFLNAVNCLAQDPGYILEAQSKNPDDALRCYPRRPEDGRIDWYKISLQVLRLINASNKPYSGAYCKFENKKMVIWDAEIVEQNENICAVPGQVTKVGEGYIEVACQEGKLLLKIVEIDGEIDAPTKWIQSTRKRLE